MTHWQEKDTINVHIPIPHHLPPHQPETVDIGQSKKKRRSGVVIITDMIMNEYTYDDDQRYDSSKWRKYAKIPIFVCLIFVWFYFIREVFGRAPGDMREIDYFFDRIERELWRSGIFR